MEILRCDAGVLYLLPVTAVPVFTSERRRLCPTSWIFNVRLILRYNTQNIAILVISYYYYFNAFLLHLSFIAYLKNFPYKWVIFWHQNVNITTSEILTRRDIWTFTCDEMILSNVKKVNLKVERFVYVYMCVSKRYMIVSI